MTYSGLIMTLEKSRVQIQVRGLGGGTKWWHETVVALGGGTTGSGVAPSLGLAGLVARLCPR